MNERLSRGQRKHNRLEKAAAKREHRYPNLVVPTLKPREIMQNITLLTETLSSVNVAGDQTSEDQFAISEPLIRKRPARSLPSFENIINAGSSLSIKYQGLTGNTEGERVYVSDMQAVRILERLEAAIESGQISTHEEIAKQIDSLGAKMGCMGSVTTEIDMQAYWVLEAIRKNSKKLS